MNRYFRFSKISEKTFKEILQNFAEDQTATDTANWTDVSVRSVNAIFLRIRERIATSQENRHRDAKRLGSDYEIGWWGDFDDERYIFHLDRMKKFHGISERTVYLHARESEFRYDHQSDIYEYLLLLLRKDPL